MYSMSCRCENTANQLAEFVDWWGEDPDAMTTRIAESPTEKAGVQRIIELSRQILELAGESGSESVLDAYVSMWNEHLH